MSRHWVPVAFLFLLGASAASGCTHPASIAPPDAGVSLDAGDAPVDAGPIGHPTFNEIFDDYFGLSGAASCSVCHTTPDQPAVIASRFTCLDIDDCFASLVGASLLVRAQDIADPASSRLIKTLHQETGSGVMPLDSQFIFSARDIARIESWIADGALRAPAPAGGAGEGEGEGEGE